jgi:hypothetical protein
VINVDLNAVSPQIVIEGNVYNTTNAYTVQITSTVNFSSANSFPSVSGAIVKITDATNHITDSLTETLPGIYTTHLLQGLPGHTYQLFVSAQGQTYTASSTMPQPVAFDSLTFLHSNIFGIININPVVNFKDSAGIANYYLFTPTVNQKRLKTTFPFDDRLSDGKYISQQIFLDSAYISVGDQVSVQMKCVDKNIWNYFYSLYQLTDPNQQPVSPANPVSNISNNALGYFNASTIQTKIAIAK